MAEPEKLARRQIDAQLAACGWAIQDYKQFNPSAGRGIALREAPLKSGTCDYLLLVDRQTAGVIDPAAVPDWQKFERQFSTTHDLRLAKNPRK